MRTHRVLPVLLLAAFSGYALAHSAPNSLVILDFAPHSVHAQMLVPESELAFATAAEAHSQPLAAYFLRHVGAETADGVRWRVAVRSVRSTRYFEHDYLLAEIDLTPPAGVSPRGFVLIDDAVTHEVRNHVVTVHARGAAQSEFLGALQYPARRLAIRQPPGAGGIRTQ
jgi:hypothetical protein